MNPNFRLVANEHPRDELRLAERSGALGVTAAVLSMLALLAFLTASQTSLGEVIRIAAPGAPLALAAAAAAGAVLSRRRLAALRGRRPSLTSLARAPTRRAAPTDGAHEDARPIERSDEQCTSPRRTS